MRASSTRRRERATRTALSGSAWRLVELTRDFECRLHGVLQNLASGTGEGAVDLEAHSFAAHCLVEPHAVKPLIKDSWCYRKRSRI